MSHDPGLWVIVEGRTADRPHYERLLTEIFKDLGLTPRFRLAEEIELMDEAGSSSTAGGKSRALKIHDMLADTDDGLMPSNSAATSLIVFMLDRDRDDFTCSMSDSNYVFYTDGCDVEADILVNCDIWSSVRFAYGIDSEVTDRIIDATGTDPALALLSAWRDWLILGLVALDSGSPDLAPLSKHSMINKENFIDVSPEKKLNLEKAIRDRIGDQAFKKSSKRAENYLNERGVRSLKGRHIADYIDTQINMHSGTKVQQGSPKMSLVSSASTQLDHSKQWTSRYKRRFQPLISAIGKSSGK